MAQFLRLEIQGIRSVGHTPEDAHHVTFLTPCTLISGPNGTGKTTIIEALNYITTSALPSGKMPAFIHSAEVARKPRIDALVRLEFLDVKKNLCTATKRLTSISGKNGKATCKSEEFTLVVQLPDGSKKTLSSKVIDFQKAMNQHLGVPSAILNLVIFCHQEDSTWPLSEPKELKMRFDEIFQLTQFVKAQDQMRKIKSNYEKEIKFLNEKTARCEDLLKNKSQVLQEYRQCEAKKLKGKERQEELENVMREMLEERRELEKKIKEIERSIRDLEHKEFELQNVCDKMEILRVVSFSGTEDQLKQEIDEMKQSKDAIDFENEKRRIARKKDEVARQVEILISKKRDLERQISELKAKSMHRDALQKEVQLFESDLARQLNISDKGAIEEALLSYINERSGLMEESVRRTNEGADECQEKVDEAQKIVTKIELEMKSSEDEKRKLESSIREMSHKLRSIEDSSTGLRRLTAEIENIETQLDELPFLDENYMSRLIQQRNESQKTLDELNRRCTDAEQFAEQEKDLEKKRIALSDVDQKLGELSSKHTPNWEALYGDAEKPSAPWTDAVAEVNEEMRSSLRYVDEQLTEAQMNSQSIRTKLQQCNEESRKLDEEMTTLREKIYQMCNCDVADVSNRLKEIRLELKKARKELAPINAKYVLYESWIEETEQKSCCPLCDRKFASKASVATFTNKLKDVSIVFPDERDELEKRVLHLEEKEKEFAGAEVYSQQLREVETEKEQARSKMRILEKELYGHEDNVRKQTTGQKEFHQNLVWVMALQADVALMDSLYESSEKLRVEIENLQRFTRKQNDNESYSQLKKMCSEQEDKYRQIMKEGDEMQKKYNQKNSLQAELNRLREKRVTLGEATTQATHLRDQMKSKEAELSKLSDNISRLFMRMPNAREKLEIVMLERTQRNEEKRQMEVKLLSDVNDLKQKRNNLQEMKRKLDGFSLGILQSSSRSNELSKVEDEIAACQERKIALELQVNNLDGTQAKHRTLEDQLTKMLLEKKKKNLEDDIATLKDLGADKREMERLKERNEVVRAEYDKANKEGIRLSGVLEENGLKLQQSMKNLSRKEVADAEKAYRDVVVKCLLVKEIITDIDKYTRCLDQSLIKFHTEKMEAINEIVDDLWRKVYKGMDIETIRIRSNTNETSSKNRAYDYTVVMVVEGGIEIEMRGRCSAGQKMLASLLIRIALADVFGGLCSMIALDEPTTNLDDLKVEHMAEMLNELIAARRSVDEDGKPRGRQMQMLVITHDERLVNKLTLGCRPEYIYILGKNQRGLSYIKKRMPDGHEEGATGPARLT